MRESLVFEISYVWIRTRTPTVVLHKQILKGNLIWAGSRYCMRTSFAVGGKKLRLPVNHIALAVEVRNIQGPLAPSELHVKQSFFDGTLLARRGIASLASRPLSNTDNPTNAKGLTSCSPSDQVTALTESIKMWLNPNICHVCWVYPCRPKMRLP